VLLRILSPSLGKGPLADVHLDRTSQLKSAVGTEVPNSDSLLYFASHANSTRAELKYRKELGGKNSMHLRSQCKV